MEFKVFDDKESILVDQCLNTVRYNNLKRFEDTINKNIYSLVELARAISQYPSIFKTNYLGEEERSVGTLIEMLCENADFDKVFNIPTKAVLGKGYLIAKLNFFLMLKYLIKSTPGLEHEKPKIISFITNTVFTIMSEEVFVNIIKSKDYSPKIRNRAGFLLVNIWEYRINQSIEDFAPALNSLWSARKKVCPTLGTTLGVMEISMLSSELPGIWLDFLEHEENMDEKIDALKEFLFGITFEELKLLQEKMAEKNLKCIKNSDLEKVLEKKKSYPDYDIEDPREIYRFFKHRKANARFRQRSGHDGPKKTIEELMIAHYLEAFNWPNNV